MSRSVRSLALASRSAWILPGAAGAGLLLAGLAGPGCGGRVVVDLPVEGTGGSDGTGGFGGAPTTGPGPGPGPGGSGGVGGTGGAGVPTLYEVDLGSVADQETVELDVPGDTLGFGMIVRAPSAFGQLGVQLLLAPSGAPMIVDYNIPPTNWLFAWYGTTVASVPQSDAEPGMPTVMPGIWWATLGDPTGPSGPGDVSLWLRRTVDGQFHGGELDVNVFIAGGAATPEYLAEMLVTSYSGYAGLTLGSAAFFELPAQYAVIADAYQFLEVLEQTSAAALRPALNIIAIADLTGELDNAAGVAAGIPGQGVEHGTHSSGVVMEVFNDHFFDSVIMEHEGGHLAGLFHTSEIEPPAHDPLADTGHCMDVEGQWESCPDFDNVMFPYGSEAKLMTPMQERVVRGSLLYRGVYADGYPAEPPLGASAKQGAAAALTPVRVIDLAKRSREARRARPAAPSRAWASGISRAAAGVLSGVWCQGQGGAVDHFAVLKRAGGDDPARLLAIGADPAAPVQARKRALAAAGRLAPPPQVVAAMAAIAESAEAPRQVRVGALRGLEAAGAPEVSAVAQRLGGADPVLAEVARRVLGQRPAKP